MTNYKLSTKELTSHLKDQIYFLINSAISYDKGFEGESKRIAATIRILIKDKTSCSALLTQLGKYDILFYDSATPFEQQNLMPCNCLCMVRLQIRPKEDLKESKGDYIAPLEWLAPSRNSDRKVSLDRWWNRNIVIRDKDGITYTRKDIILKVAENEGGAHVDPKLTQSYANLTKFNSMGWKMHSADNITDFGNPVPSNIRQIAHETIKSLIDGTLDLFNPADKEYLKDIYNKYINHCISVQTKTEEVLNATG